jgi:selenoprotein W-related protein
VSAGSPRHHVEIHFCDRCGTRPAALELCGEIFEQWAAELAAVNLVPVADDRFDVLLDGETIFSMSDRGRRPESGEINTILESRLGPPPGFGA